jgi:hypothetical protein
VVLYHLAGLEQFHQSRVGMLEFDADAVFVDMPDICRLGEISAAFSILEQQVNIDAVIVPEGQNTAIRLTIEHHALLADIPYPATLGDGMFPDEYRVQMYGDACLAVTFHGYFRG